VAPPCSAVARETVERLLRGNDATLEPPRMERGEHRLVAARVRELAARPRLVCDPTHYAVRLGYALVDRAPAGVGGEVTDGSVILYRWHRSARVRGLRVAHGLAHGVLVDWRWPHNEADAWHVAAELLWPAEMSRSVRNAATAARLQPHAPRWVLEAQILQALKIAQE